jgi:KipI family sensor histidine kinase inhibitor
MPSSVEIRPVEIRTAGDRGLLVEMENLDGVLSFAATVRAAGLPSVEEVIPAARTVLVRCRPETDLAEVRSALHKAAREVRIRPVELSDTTAVIVPVHYDGPDLEDVAAICGLTTAQLISAHTGSRYRGAFAGFAPGFCYLSGGDPLLLDIPRRTSPRTRVPAGSVGLAGEFAAVYPRESPGGWQLIGRTDLTVWNTDATPPALIQPGQRVRFVDADRGNSDHDVAQAAR